MEYDGWYDEAREYTRRLVAVRSVSPGAGETEATREELRLLHEGGMADAYTESGLDPIADDPHGRHNAYAVLCGRSARPVVLLGHVDTVQTAAGRTSPASAC